MSPTRILFVCAGNICRSPTAEAVMQHLVDEAGRSDEFEIDSAGTGGWHVGAPADPRSREAAARRGLDLTSVARAVSPNDFDHFDVIASVDEENLIRLRHLAPPDSHAEIRMLGTRDVPDPYYRNDGFDEVLDIIEVACADLLAELT